MSQTHIVNLDKFQIQKDQAVHLSDWQPDDTSSFNGTKEEALDSIQELKKRLEELQEKLYAEKKH